MTRIPNLRIAIVGAGLMGRAHARASARVGAKIVAITDADLVAANTLASSVGARAALPDDILDADRVDAIHICTPVSKHVEWCSRAIERGIHVLCEKPLAENAADTAALFDLAAERGVLLCPVHQFPFQQGAIAASERLTTIGKVRWITAEMCTAGAATVVDSMHDEIVLGIVPHPLSLILAFLGGPIADGEWNSAHADRGEVLVAGTVRDTGVSIVLSTHGRPTSNTMRLIGERGSIALDLFHGFSTIETGRVSRMRKLARPFVSSARTLSAASSNALRRGIARETEFPGLTQLCRRFYLAADKRAEPPILAAEAIDIATVRDRIIASVVQSA